MTWQQRLNRAQKTGKFTTEDRSLVRCWGTCPVGEKLRLTSDSFLRMTPKAARFGMMFLDAVDTNDVATALQCYNEIQLMKVSNKNGFCPLGIVT